MPFERSTEKLCNLRDLCKTVPMADEKELKDQRVPIMMTPSELEAIDDWMFKNRIRSRGEAIRRLCQVALATDKKSEAIFELSASVLKRRTNEAGKVSDKLKELRETGSTKPDFLSSMVDNTLEALKDHARLFLAINGLVNPLGIMKATDNIEEALKFAEQAREGLDDIRDDIAIIDKALADAAEILADSETPRSEIKQGNKPDE